MDARGLASGFIKLLASQLSSRVITFSLNLAVARHLTPEAYGLSTVQFHLLLSTVMMLSREAFRRGCLRFKPESGSQAVDPWRVLSVAWLVLPLGALATAGACAAALALHARSPEAHAVPAYSQAVGLHGVAALVELAAEPFYILASIHLRFGLRAAMDSLPLALKAGLTLALLAGWLGPRAAQLPPALVFSYAQLAFAACTLAGYGLAVGLPLLRGRNSAGDPGGAAVVKQRAQPTGANAGVADTAGAGLPKQVQTGIMARGSQERAVLGSIAVFWVQSVEKLFLAEGSKMVMAGLAGSYDQGVVGLVGGLGSLVVRLLLAPMEDLAFTVFSRQRADAKEGAEGLRPLAQTLTLLVKLAALLGLLCAAFGPPNARLALRLVYGPRWAATRAPEVLAVYCVYILLLALNGVTEAFVHAVLDTAGLATSNLILLGVACTHLVACGGLITRLGSVGFVTADALNMALRIAVSLWYIRRFFAPLPGFSVRQLLPRPGTLFVLGSAYGIMIGYQALVIQRLPHPPYGAVLNRHAALMQISVAVGVLGVVGAALLRTERELLRSVRQLGTQRRGQEPGSREDSGEKGKKE